jgi:Pyruvate/2-oxoacid:ferredoxin oxidoreductase delta subunit
MNQQLSWYRLLSVGQKRWLFGSLLFIILITAIGFIKEPGSSGDVNFKPATSMTLAQLSKELEVTKGNIARELGLPLETSKVIPVAELGISIEQLDDATHHILSHVPAPLKYFVFFAIVLWGLVFLAFIGRPEGNEIKERKLWYPRWVYLFTLSLSVLAAGFLLGKSPNPMESAVKVFKTMVGLYPDPMAKLASLLFFFFLAFIGNKIICGWACPFGALEELIYSLPLFKSIKKKKIPFWFSNGIRTLLFVAMLLLMFGVVGGKRGFVLYHSLNPFNLFALDLESTVLQVAVLSYILLSFITYRPFCAFICPFGLLSWFVERISIFKVRVDSEKCTKCGACYLVCPNNAIKDRVEHASLPSDCFSCTRCLNSCPVDAISYCRSKTSR